MQWKPAIILFSVQIVNAQISEIAQGLSGFLTIQRDTERNIERLIEIAQTSQKNCWNIKPNGKRTGNDNKGTRIINGVDSNIDFGNHRTQ